MYNIIRDDKIVATFSTMQEAHDALMQMKMSSPDATFSLQINKSE